MTRCHRLLVRFAALTAAGALALTWWGWHSLDAGLLLLGSRLC
ncbi:hypothetical protein [Halomonas kalidii]|uniref:Uncharacterized protein n=1 Tax=Halomonas kalidii TaxID=3043293 RepID=A0ABT6VR28_9GAMM|nr:hypothetical protein [Halomonas kalidii]MDI5936442.1 hypothetical protein [Halomonas kalidii]